MSLGLDNLKADDEWLSLPSLGYRSQLSVMDKAIGFLHHWVIEIRTHLLKSVLI